MSGQVTMVLGDVALEAERALTLWQPWASAICSGPKRIENRPIPPPDRIIGQRIFIHAGKTWDHERAADLLKLWRRELPSTAPDWNLGNPPPSGAFVIADKGAQADHFEILKSPIDAAILAKAELSWVASSAWNQRPAPAQFLSMVVMFVPKPMTQTVMFFFFTSSQATVKRFSTTQVSECAEAGDQRR